MTSSQEVINDRQALTDMTKKSLAGKIFDTKENSRRSVGLKPHSKTFHTNMPSFKNMLLSVLDKKNFRFEKALFATQAFQSATDGKNNR